LNENFEEGPLKVGKILKTFGLKGEVKVLTEFDVPDELLEIQHIFVELPRGGKKYLEIERTRSCGGRTLIVKFRGIDSIEMAEALRGLELFVKREDLKEPAEGEYYIFQLVGLKIIGREGREIGVVINAIKNPGHDLLEVETRESRVFMVPMVKEMVKKVDLERKIIEVELPPGLVPEKNET